jgi:AcrR family transcriptional regulator
MAPPAANIPAVLEAAMGIFFQFGFKKASMDDVALAAGLSRQALYLKFSSKERLFQAALEHFTQRLLKEAQEPAHGAGRDVEARLLTTCGVLYGDFGASQKISELLEHARSKYKEVVEQFEHDFVDVVESLLVEAGVDRQWSPAHISSRQLAEHLLSAASGIKANAANGGDFTKRMSVAVSLVVRGQAASRAQ